MYNKYMSARPQLQVTTCTGTAERERIVGLWPYHLFEYYKELLLKKKVFLAPTL